ncbi:MAG: rhodanese-like domain-containing protein [Coriobacteriia bacterium]
MSYKRWMTALLATVLVLGLVAVPGCATEDTAPAEVPAAEETTASEPSADIRTAMIEAANEYFKSEPTPTIAGADLLKVVNDKDPAYQIVDIRSAEHYALGHIDGAINIPFETTADDESLAKLDDTKRIVVVCYTGHTASMVNMVWNMLGYDAVTLKFGMSGWVADKAIVGVDIPGKAGAGYPTVSTPTEAAGPFEAPELEGEYADVAEAIKGQARAYFARDAAPTIAPEDVYAIVQAKDPAYQIISVRKPEDYAKGHIDGAINILWTDIADNLDKVDPSKKIIIYCYTGHTGGEATMFLNLMGYDAHNMKFGMSGWTNDTGMGGLTGFDPATVPGYPTVK